MGDRGTRAGVGLLVFFASLPLQWDVVLDTPYGVIRWFHLGALLLLALAPPNAATFRAIQVRGRPLGLGVAALTFMLFVTAVAYDSAWAAPLQNAIYAVVGLCVGCTLLTALDSDRGRRIVAWSGPVALLSFAVFFTRTLAAAGTSPSAVISAVLSADPSAALFRFFRVVFRSLTEAQAVQVRHEIFAALLVATYVSLMSRPRGIPRVVAVVSTVLVGVLTLVSLSRAVTIAAMLPLALGTIAFFLRSRLTGTALAVLAAGIVAIPFVLPTILNLLETRFVEDTGSYEARLGALSQLPIGDVATRLLLGGADFERSTHTMIGDAALRGGILAALGACAIVYVIGRHTARAVRDYFATGHIAAIAAAAAGFLALVRAFTAGGGLLHLVEWSAIGIMLAAEIVRTRAAVRPAEAPPAAPAGAGRTPIA